MSGELDSIFESAGSVGMVCAQDSTGEREVSLRADEPVVAASLFKLLLAVEVERGIGDDRLDPTERVRLLPEARTPGPVGFSLNDDAVEVALGDLLVPMLTISDNVAAYALLDRVGIEACNQTATRLGMSRTRIVSDLRTMIDGAAQAAGFADWAALTAWDAESQGDDDEWAAVQRRVRAAPQLQPATATRTTAGDMCRLLRAIWTDRAAPPEGCERIRRLMGRQMTSHRLASGFRPPVRVAAKSGGLFGIFRHEAGVVELAGRWYPVAVCTVAEQPGSDAAAINSGSKRPPPGLRRVSARRSPRTARSEIVDHRADRHHLADLHRLRSTSVGTPDRRGRPILWAG